IMHKEKRKRRMKLLRGGARLVTVIAVAIGLFPCRGQTADEPRTTMAITDTKTMVDASDPLGTLRSEVDNVDAAYEACQKATSDDQREATWNRYVETNDAVVPKIVEGVRQSPTSP